MATTPAYASSAINIGQADVSSANPQVDGTGALATILTAGASGTVLESIVVKGRVATGSTQAADTVRLFLHDGATARLWRDVAVPAGGGAIAAAVQNFETTIVPPPGFRLKTGWSLRASTHVGGATASYVVSAFGSDF